MTKIILPYIPKSPMYVDGIMTREWQNFFRSLFLRVGGYDSPDLDELSLSQSVDYFGSSSSLLGRIESIESSIDLVINELSKLKELDEVRSSQFQSPSSPQTLPPHHLELFLPDMVVGDDADVPGNVREGFKYYLPQTVHDDIRVPVGSVLGAGSFPPSATAYKSSYVFAFDTGPNNQSVQFIVQIPHGYKQGTALSPHIHFTIPTSGSGVGAENIKWDFTYSWANNGGTFPAESTDTVTVDVQNVSADEHVKSYFSDISGVGKNISSVLICSLTRDVSVANDYADDAYFLEFDFHFEMDSIGSRLIGEK